MRIRAIAVAVTAAACLSLLAIPAAAHIEHAQGDLVMVVGFANEPAYAGQPNAAQITFTHAGEPVTDVGDMTVTLTSGGTDSGPLALEPVFDTPGEYRAPFVPSRPGAYAFHFVGEVDGEEVDQTFRSGPRTFSEVEDVSAAAFPPVTAPSNEDLATRIDQEAARTAESLDAAETSAASALEEASGARSLGTIGIVVGAIGLAVGIAGFAAARRRA